MALFSGEFEQTIDAKHRLAISASLREQADPRKDGRDFYVVLGPNRNLHLYPGRHFDRLEALRRKTPLPTRRTQRLDTLFAFTRKVRPDTQGRIVLPEKLLERSRIDRKVMLVGLGNRIEIWPLEDWAAEAERRLAEHAEIFYDMADLLEQDATAREDAPGDRRVQADEQDRQDSTDQEPEQDSQGESGSS